MDEGAAAAWRRVWCPSRRDLALAGLVSQVLPEKLLKSREAAKVLAPLRALAPAEVARRRRLAAKWYDRWFGTEPLRAEGLLASAAHVVAKGRNSA